MPQQTNNRSCHSDVNFAPGNRSPYTHILWDWNGTLMDDIHLCVEITNVILQARQLPAIDVADHHALFDFPIDIYYQRLGIIIDREDFPKINIEFSDAYEERRKECPLHPNTHEVLAGFQQAGLEQSILSAYPQQTLEEIVEFYGLSGFFTHLFGHRKQMGEGKIEQGRACLETLEAVPEKILLIGDTMHDHEVAQDLGIDCILLCHGHHSRQRLLQCGVPIHDSLQSIQSKFLGANRY